MRTVHEVKLDFPLKEIRMIMESPDFNRNRALEQQITLLILKKERPENLIDPFSGCAQGQARKRAYCPS